MTATSKMADNVFLLPKMTPPSARRQPLPSNLCFAFHFLHIQETYSLTMVSKGDYLGGVLLGVDYAETSEIIPNSIRRYYHFFDLQ